MKNPSYTRFPFLEHYAQFCLLIERDRKSVNNIDSKLNIIVYKIYPIFIFFKKYIKILPRGIREIRPNVPSFQS